MHAEFENRASNLSRRPRLTTLVRVRWLAIAGQPPQSCSWRFICSFLLPSAFALR